MARQTSITHPSLVNTATAAIVLDSADEIAKWRIEQLVKGGYSQATADKLGRQQNIDLHYAVEMLQRGCSEALALEILL